MPISLISSIHKGIKVASILLLVVVPAVTAAEGQNQFTARPQAGQQAQKADDETQFAAQPLKDRISIPNLPDYSGNAKFVRGITFPNALNGPSYVLHFKASEKRDTVRNWYEQSLLAYDWKIDRATGNSLSAVHKSGDSINITFTAGSANGLESEFKIYYHANRRR